MRGETKDHRIAIRPITSKSWKMRTRIGKEELRQYRRFPARRLARCRHHHRQIARNPKKRKVKTGLESMPIEGLCLKKGFWRSLTMVDHDPAVYGLVSQRRS